jgi:hypothetical protein
VSTSVRVIEPKTGSSTLMVPTHAEAGRITIPISFRGKVKDPYPKPK